MKIVAVSDHFVRTEHYEECFAKYPEYELKTIFFGTEDRFEMRDIFHKIEKIGPEAWPIPEELYTEILPRSRIPYRTRQEASRYSYQPRRSGKHRG